METIIDANEYAVDVQNLRVWYKTSAATVYAVNGINLQLKKGKTLGIVGETGAGKTSSMLSLMKLISPPQGFTEADRMIVDGHDISALTVKELSQVRGTSISMIFQDPMTSLNPAMKVGTQIAEGIRLHENISKAEAFERAIELLETVGIDGSRCNDYPHQFSGGMRQRVVIAIALACKPAVLIADEPTSALDVTIQAQVLKLMRELKEKYGSSMFLITHDLGVIAEMCDEVAVMYAGRIVERGSLAQVFNNTLHPYTEGLFNSLPNINNRVNMLKPIVGLMPDPTQIREGCDFASRCPYATEKCFKSKPYEAELEPGHLVCCSAYEDRDFKIARVKKDV